MLQQERINDNEESLRIALEGWQSHLWTAIPGVVVSYDPVQGTCVIQPSVQARLTDEVGNVTWQTRSPLPSVPVVYLGGGDFVATFPIQAGDEALVIFAARCIDAWWLYGGVQPAGRQRMHDPNDGFALIGPRSLARALTNVSATTAQLRTVDGSTYIELAPGGNINLVAPGAVTITGNLQVNGTVTATEEGTFNGIPVSSHVHGGVATGGATTGAPEH